MQQITWSTEKKKVMKNKVQEDELFDQNSNEDFIDMDVIDDSEDEEYGNDD